jgi:microsomal dipeptidase-like Zn-dependent dipeptidase
VIYTRRKFIQDTINACAGMAISSPLLSTLGYCSEEFIVPDLPAGRVFADIHAHAGINEWNRLAPLAVKYPALIKIAEKFINKTGMNWKDCHAAGIDLICATHFSVFDEWLSMPSDPNPQAPDNTFHMIEALEDKLESDAKDYAKLARNPGELKKLLAIKKNDSKFRVAVVHTVEGGHALGGSLEALDHLAELGVAMICITHFFNKGIASAANSYPFFPDAGAEWANQGLSDFGRAVMCRMEQLGMIVDITHATPTAVAEIIDHSCRPLVTSHASVYTLGDHPYSLYDEHIQEIVGNGGLMGVALYPYILGNFATLHDADVHGSLKEVVRTVRYIVKLCGDHKNVAIGSDFGGYITGPNDMSRLSQIDRLRKLLMDEFECEKTVEDILANNAINFLLANWGNTEDK